MDFKFLNFGPASEKYKEHLYSVQRVLRKFNQDFPEHGKRLGLANEEFSIPSIERLIHANALLGAKFYDAIHHPWKWTANNFLKQHMPAYQMLMPALGTVQFSMKPDGYTQHIPSGTIFKNDEDQCFMTSFSVSVLPIEIHSSLENLATLNIKQAETQIGNGFNSFIKTQIKWISSQHGFKEFVEHFSFKIHHENNHLAFNLIDLLCHPKTKLFIRALNSSALYQYPRQNIQWVGAKNKSSMFKPFSLSDGFRSDALQMILEAIYYPDKFYYFSLLNFKKFLLENDLCKTKALELIFCFSEIDKINKECQLQDVIKTNCTPVIFIQKKGIKKKLGKEPSKIFYINDPEWIVSFNQIYCTDQEKNRVDLKYISNNDFSSGHYHLFRLHNWYEIDLSQPAQWKLEFTQALDQNYLYLHMEYYTIDKNNLSKSLSLKFSHKDYVEHLEKTALILEPSTHFDYIISPDNWFSMLSILQRSGKILDLSYFYNSQNLARDNLLSILSSFVNCFSKKTDLLNPIHSIFVKRGWLRSKNLNKQKEILSWHNKVVIVLNTEEQFSVELLSLFLKKIFCFLFYRHRKINLVFINTKNEIISSLSFDCSQGA